MNNVRTIFFDLDDTLVDHAHARREAMRDTYERFRAVFHQIPLDVLDRTFEKVNDELWGQLSRGEISAEELRTQRFLRTLQSVFALTPLIKYDLRDAFDIDPYFVERYEFHTRELPDASAMLRSLHGRYALGVLTNGLSDIQSRRLKALGWSNLFTHVVTPDTAGAMKPHGRIFEAAEHVSQCAPSEIVFVGDSHHYDIAAAKRRGWRTVWYNPSSTAPPDGSADDVVRALGDVTRLFVRTSA